MMKILLVLLHGYTNRPASLEAICSAITDNLESQGHRVAPLMPELPLRLFSRAPLAGVAEQTVNDISAAMEDAQAAGDPIERIILIGHSFGALLARKVYVIACGETEKAPFERGIDIREGVAWAPLVERVVLLAGINRGWRINHQLGLGKAIGWTLGATFARLARPFGRHPFLITRVQAGSEFITNLRIQWLRMRRRHVQGQSVSGGATVVQLLGSIDDYVSPEDNVDLTTGSDFIYLDVPYSGHKSVIDLADSEVPPGAPKSKGALRGDAIVLAATGDAEALRATQLEPRDLNVGASEHDEVEAVIFVVHGIRDGGYWTQKLARAVLRQSGKAKVIATETSSYGYFPMLSFLFSRRRRDKSEWLMNEYAEALACYPKAQQMHFVGHSNGTYCLADALRRYPACHFDNVVFAGSVVRSGYRWDRIVRNSPRRAEYRLRYGSIGRLLNLVATADWVVAGFPNLFQAWLPIQRLGGAGHFGFWTKGPDIFELRYAKGGHGAGIQEPLWPTIADFVLHGRAPRQPAAKFASGRNWVVAVLGILPPLAWLSVGLSILLLGKLIHFGASALACRLGERAANCLANLPSIGTVLHPSNWFALPENLVMWIVPLAVLLYVLFIKKLLTWV